nr:putative ribonuclease H-like domain-containing protein [Tanacetum cinerariifolium]
MIYDLTYIKPPGFQDPEFPDGVYKVEKAMYGLHQAPRAWYGTLSKYLLANGFQMGTIDLTLFIRKHRGDFLLVQVYVDDIIFGSPNSQLCREFEALMHDKFQMSAMGELNFFLGLQVLQKNDGIFLSQDKAQHRFPPDSGFCGGLPYQGEGSGTPTEPHHIPSLEVQQSPHPDFSSSLHPTATTETIPTKTLTEIPTLRQYSRRATWIAQSKALSTAADEPASLLRDDSQGEAFPIVSGLEVGHDRENIIKTSALPHDLTSRVTSLDADEGTQDLEISSLKARIKLLEDKDKGSAEQSGDDAPIKGRSVETGEEAGVEKSIKRGNNNTKELVNSQIRQRKKLQEQIDVQMAKEMEEQMAREDQRMDEQIARDAKIARIHPEEELQMLIDGLDRNNEVIAKHLQEYEQSEAELTIREKIDMINELVKYQDHHAKILKYQAQQSKPLSKKEQREFYITVLKIHSGWKTKHFKGMTLGEIREKFIPGSAKKMKTSEDVSEEDLKEMMQLVPVEEVYVEALQVKYLIIDWEIHTESKRDYWNIIRLGGHIAVCQFFVDMLKQLDREDLNQLDQEIFMLVERDYRLRRGLAIVMISNTLQKTNAIMIHDSEETLILAEESHSKMLLKQEDPMMSEKKVNTKPVDYVALNQLSQDFETRFVLQTELSAEQVFWSQNYVNSEEPNLSTRPTPVEVPKKLPKSQENDMVIMKLKERIKSLSENMKGEKIKQEKVLVITTLKDTLRELKGKVVVDEAVILHPIDPELLKIDVTPLAPKLQNNRTAHYDYLKHTQEETATLREIV